MYKAHNVFFVLFILPIDNLQAKFEIFLKARLIFQSLLIYLPLPNVQTRCILPHCSSRLFCYTFLYLHSSVKKEKKKLANKLLQFFISTDKPLFSLLVFFSFLSYFPRLFNFVLLPFFSIEYARRNVPPYLVLSK